MSLLLNALKKAEEGENKAAAQAAPEGAAPPPAAPAPASAPTAAPATPAAPAPAPTTPPTASTPAPATAPAAPAARPGGLAAGGGLSLKKADAPAAPVASAAAMPTPATAAADRVSGAAGMGLRKTAAPRIVDEAGPSVDDDSARSVAGRVLSGAAPADEPEGAGRGFRAARNFLLAAAFLAAVGGGGYFTLESGLIPGVSTQSLLQLVGVQPPPPPPVAARTNLPSFNVEQGEILRLPRPAIDVQSEIDFTSDLPTGGGAGQPAQEDTGRRSIASLITDYEEQRREDAERERELELAQLVDDGQISEEELAGLVNVDESDAPQEPAAVRAPLPDEVFTAADSRAEKARVEAMTPSDDDIVIISAAQKVAMALAAEEAEQAAEQAEMAADEMIAEGDALADGTAVAQADNAAPEAPAEGEAAAGGGSGGGSEGGETMAAETMEKEESMAAEEIVAPSLKGEERRAALARAKRFYLSGQLAAAEAAYRAVWRRDPNNLDAMRGMAQIALASGRRQLARTMYAKILDIYPNDPVAVAELANLLEGGDPQAMERRIFSALGKQPEADARLYFALGNLYAARELWSKAQEAYFEAVTLEAGNPDYVYNLAVVLDYLNKPRLAARYYRQALDLARASPSGFNLAQTEARIRDLEQ